MDELQPRYGRKRVYPKLSDFAKNKLCTDDTDKDILMALLKYGRSTISQLTMIVFGNSSKDRQTTERLERLNERSLEHLSRPLLKNEFSPDTAWWLIDSSLIES